MTAAQLRENAELLSHLESQQRFGTPVDQSMLARIIEALKVKS